LGLGLKMPNKPKLIKEKVVINQTKIGTLRGIIHHVLAG
jgi:hypothetical protein